MNDNDPEVIHSDLSGVITRDGITVRVDIFRLAHEEKWHLEVVNELGTSEVWDDPFESDADAMAAFEHVVEEEGMETFLNGEDADTLH